MSGGARTTSAPLDGDLLEPRTRSIDDVRVVPIEPGFWCLRIPLPFHSHHGPVPFARPAEVNCYLLEDREGWILVDCGPTAGLGWSGLARAIELTGVPLGAVHTLLLTHLHPDHASLAATTVERLGCRLWRGRGPDAIVDRLRDPIVPLTVRREWAGREGVPVEDFPLLSEPIGRDAPTVRPAADRLLETGDVIPTRTGNWRVHAAPGHSPTQVALVDPAGRRAITADAAYAAGFPYLEYGPTPDPFAEAITTLHQLAALDLQRVFAGHGPPDDAPAARFAAAEDALRQALDAHRAVLATDRPLSGYEIARRMTGDSPDPDQRSSATAFALVIAEHLVAAGEVVAERAPRDGIRRFRLSG